MRRMVRAVAATSLLLLLLAGLPLILALSVGNPAHGWSALVVGDLSDDVILDLLAALAWLAWASFAWSVAREILTLALDAPRPHLPGSLPGFQSMAHTLVAASFMVLPTIASAHGTGIGTSTTSTAFTTLRADPIADLAQASALPDHALVAGHQAGTHGRAAPTVSATTARHRAEPVQYVVPSGGPPTLWDLAQSRLGDGMRWKDIWDLNAGRHQPDGSVMRIPGPLKPGWRLLLPANTPDVEAGDSWAGGPQRPAQDARDPHLTATRDPHPSASGMPVFALGSGSGLLGGLVLRELAARRRRQFRHRRPGRSIPPTPPSLAPLEKALIRHDGPAAEDAAWLDESLRRLAQHLARSGEPFPDVAEVWMNAQTITLVRASARSLGTARPDDQPPPHPWQLDTASGNWQLPREEHLAAPPQEPHHPRSQAAPYPALVTVGHTDNGDVRLLNLESARTLTIHGNHPRSEDLARHVAAQLATSPWSQQVHVTLIGVGAALAAINPDRLTYLTDPDQMLSTPVLHKTAKVQILIIDLNNTSLAGKLAAQPPLRSMVTAMSGIAVMGLDSDQRTSATIAERSDRQSGPGNWMHTTLQIDDDGHAIWSTTGENLTVHGLSAADAERLAQLLTTRAESRDEETPPARGQAPWDALSDAAGAPLRQLTKVPGLDTAVAAGEMFTSPQAPARDDPTVPAAGDGQSVLGLDQPDVLVTHSATTARDVRQLAPHLGRQLRHLVTNADPALEADLAAWFATSGGPARLAVLGPLNVRALGPLPPSRPRLRWNTEVVAYLAAHPRGVTADHLAAELWPDDPTITGATQKVRQAVYTVRRWLGKDPLTGEDHIPQATTTTTAGSGVYRIQHLLTDADLFRRLRTRGIANGPDGIRDLQTALSLVTGPPYDQRRPGGYSWLIDTPLDVEYTGMIIDVAHVVATHHLSAGRPDLAAEAAHVSLRADSQNDVAMLDLVAACDAQGHRGEAASWVHRILAVHDAEVEEDLPPRTAEILHGRRWLHQAS